MASDFERLATTIDGYRDVAIDFQRRLNQVPALDPSSGGDGELRKAEVLLAMLKEIGVTDITVLKAPDDRVSAGYRPSVVARLPGKQVGPTLWIMSHLDVVPAGELADWQSDPWQVRVDGDRIYGRGVEDNQQGMVSALCLARAIEANQLVLDHSLGLLFVADEETGNSLGIEYVLEHHEVFGPDDLIIVPDAGAADGSMIEVAEKGIIWFRFSVRGRSTHGSTPERGVNAHEAGARLVIRLDKLYQRFEKQNSVFDPPISTFAVTKVEAGVPNVNTVPGEHTFYMDCRVLPEYELAAVEAAVKELAHEQDQESKSTTTVTVVQKMPAAPPTPTDAKVVQALSKAVQDVYRVDGRPVGIGGGTVAACIRRKGFGVAVWATMDETMHGPNEYCLISNLLRDAKVFAHVLTNI